MENSKEENIETISLSDDEEINEDLDEIEIPEEVPQDEDVGTEEQPRRRLMIKGCCPICWEDLNTNPLGSTVCGHVFCYDCIAKVSEVCDTCPTCRQPLEGESSYHPLYLRTT